MGSNDACYYCAVSIAVVECSVWGFGDEVAAINDFRQSGVGVDSSVDHSNCNTSAGGKVVNVAVGGEKRGLFGDFGFWGWGGNCAKPQLYLRTNV